MQQAYPVNNTKASGQCQQKPDPCFKQTCKKAKPGNRLKNISRSGKPFFCPAQALAFYLTMNSSPAQKYDHFYSMRSINADLAARQSLLISAKRNLFYKQH
jgi:hypothetical protein